MTQKNTAVFSILALITAIAFGGAYLWDRNNRELAPPASSGREAALGVVADQHAAHEIVSNAYHDFFFKPGDNQEATTAFTGKQVTEEFKTRAEETGKGFFACGAQNAPASISVEPARLVEQNGKTDATVVVRMNFEMDLLTVVVQLEKDSHDGWQMANIECPDAFAR